MTAFNVKRTTLFILFLLGLWLCGCDSATSTDGNDVTDGDIDQDLMETGDSESDIEEDGDAEAEPEAEPTLLDLLWQDWQPRGVRLDQMMGVASHMKQDAGEDENRDFEFARYSELGSAILREHFRWNHVEPADDEWHFERVQTQVDMAQANNVRMIPQVGYDVDWAKTGEGDSSLIPEEYGEFCRKVAERYCDVIKDYELWNEPNMTIFWEPEPDPYRYGLLVKEGYQNIKSVCPDARVSLGGLASYSFENLFERWWFLKGLIEAHPDIGEFFDVLSLHPYTWLVSYPPENDELRGSYQTESQTRMIAMAREILSGIGKQDVPIWFTEIGWPTLNMEEETAARYLTRSALLSARDEIEAYLWYTFFDEEPEPDSYDNWGNYFGLFGYPGDAQEPRRQKKTWDAFKAIYDVLGDFRFARDLSPLLDLPEDVHVFGFIDENGKRIAAAWDGRERPDHIEDVVSEGGLETRYELSLPLPTDIQSVRMMDAYGTELSTTDAANLGDPKQLDLVLDINVKYLELQ